MSLAFTVPVAVTRATRRQDHGRSSGEIGEAMAGQQRAAQLTQAILDRTLDRADYLNRIALVYGIPAARWPQALSLGQAALSSAQPERLAAQIEILLRALERARAILEEREKNLGADPAEGSSRLQRGYRETRLRWAERRLRTSSNRSPPVDSSSASARTKASIASAMTPQAGTAVTSLLS